MNLTIVLMDWHQVFWLLRKAEILFPPWCCAISTYGLADYTVITKGDVKIAVLGIFGEDSLACAPTCVLKFKDAAKAAAETVAEIKANEDADLILCVSHAGTNTDQQKSEDEILAKKGPEIDLIVSGHTHPALDEPIRRGDT